MTATLDSLDKIDAFFLRSRGEYLIFLSCFSFFLAPANDLQQLVRFYTTSAQNELAVTNVMSVSGRLLSH